MFCYKTLFLFLIKLSNAISISLGIFSIINTPKGFKSSFLIETISLFSFWFSFIPINNIYFVCDLLLYKGKDRNGEF